MAQILYDLSIHLLALVGLAALATAAAFLIASSPHAKPYPKEGTALDDVPEFRAPEYVTTDPRIAAAMFNVPAVPSGERLTIGAALEPIRHERDEQRMAEADAASSKIPRSRARRTKPTDGGAV
jgi:hypothetical protein